MSILVLLILFFCSSFTLSFPLKYYQHAYFQPNNSANLLAVISSFGSPYTCVCQCRGYSSCLTGSYVAANQTCSLFSIAPEQGSLHWSSSQSNVVFTMVNTTITVPQAIEWDFNGNFNDQYGVYNGQLTSQSRRRKRSDEKERVSVWVSSTFNDGDSAIQFSSNTYCLINQSVNLQKTSFTITTRIYLLETIQNNLQYFPIFFHCQSLTTSHCLHLIIEQNGVRLGFYGDDLVGQTPLNSNQWYHITFVYINSNLQQRIYINGILDGNRTANYPYQGTDHQIALGPLPFVLTGDYITGYIDKITFVSYGKSAKELLNDATVVVYFAFDNSFEDSGPDKYENMGMSSVTFNSNGRFNQSLLFDAEDIAFFRILGLFYFGQINYSFSITLWIMPNSYSGTILQILSGESWCLPMLGFNSFSNLVAQSWDGETIHAIISTSSIPTNAYTHIALTYSVTNGFQFFVNGTLIEYEYGRLNYVASGTKSTITLGTTLDTYICPENTDYQISMTQYYGNIDEFKIFSRELSPSEISELVNVV